ncbi:LPXTG cell wall anchor domain-containing protein [Myceligenerans indicum]|uniref:LPXTG cell wall anchor domain-containing protein n=1 Tax=Myceligenerans indicum TaxID=2593663 RepID=A0ABS1LND2_9MICO|nr:LPXTG cell wall anchor domain-containing protein [Myceligenerans indicum]MBL0887529.1 LPXTG cell wall anchor domain-containing protein [Myceligenerans indicum]
MLRRITAAAFALAAISMPVGASSAMADQYGPDDYPCTIELSNGTVPENTTVAVRVSCDEELLAEFEAAGTEAGPTRVMAAGGALTTPMVAGRATMAALLAAAGIDTAVQQEMVTLMVVDEGGNVVRSESMNAPVDTVSVVRLTGLKPGDYTLMLKDPDGTECADRASLTVLPMPPHGLAATGATGLPYLAVAGGLLLVGAATLVVVRRARRKA